MKNLISFRVLLVVFLLAISFNSIAQTAIEPDMGDGSESNPYHISSLENLYWISEDPGRWGYHFIQTANIDASATTDWFEGQGWSPVGNVSTQFIGSYNGQGHIVDGLVIDRTSSNYIGFFGFIKEATIQKLGVTNLVVSGNYFTGGLTGASTDNSIIDKCYTTGIVTGYGSYAGGLIGSNNQTVISDSYSAVNVSGIISHTGGFAGASFNNSNISNCFSIGSVTCLGSDVGGLVGGQEESVVNNSYWNTETSGQSASAGGEGKTTTEMTWPEHTQWPFNESVYVGWDFDYIWAGDFNEVVNNGYPYFIWQVPFSPPLLGDGSENNPYQIANLDNLYWITQNTDQWNKHYIQTADIDAAETEYWSAGKGFIPIGNNTTHFSGSYNGQGHVIENLLINRGSPMDNYVGMFGYIQNGVVQNMTVSYDIQGFIYTGLIGYIDEGSIQNVTVSGMIRENAYRYIGGIAGATGENCNIVDCHSSIHIVSGEEFIGGLIGFSAGSLTDCSFSGNIYNTVNEPSYLGGLAGYANTIENSQSSVSIEIRSYVYAERIGGLAGAASTINNSHASGSLSLIDGMYIGGLAGQATTIENSYNLCNISFAGWSPYMIGGLAGYANTIKDCYNTGIIEAGFDCGTDCSGFNPYIGGLAGFALQIENSYSSGNLFAVDNSNVGSIYYPVGGLVGDIIDLEENYAVVVNSYYNYEEVLLNNEQNVITAGALDNLTYTTWLDNNLQLNINDYLTYSGGNYLINSVSDLEKLLAFGQFSQYSYLLTTDLDLAEKPGFHIPYLLGDFDGNNHEIGNLKLNMNNTFAGLFGYTYSININNLGVIDVDISGTIANTGGVAGFIYQSVLHNCYSTGSIDVNGRAGGLVGNIQNSILNKCFSTVNITGKEQVGGLAGQNAGNSTVSESFSISNVNGQSSIGGLVGLNIDSYINNSYSMGYVAGDNMVGGLAGSNISGSIENTYSLCSVTSNDDAGGLVGFVDTGGDFNDINNYWNNVYSGQESSLMGEGRTIEEMTYPYATGTFNDWDFENIWASDSNYENIGFPFLQWQLSIYQPTPQGDGSSANPFQIATLQDLYWIMVDPSRWQYHYLQTADIDASGTIYWYEGQGWIPVGNNSIKFTGTYNGMGHSIEELFINRPDENGPAGFFGMAENATIERLSIENVSVTGKSNVGGLIGISSESFLNQTFTSGYITGDVNVGGLAGYLELTELNNSFSSANVDGNDKVGGLTGSNVAGAITYCYSVGSVTGSTDTGGLAGNVDTGDGYYDMNNYWNTESSGLEESAMGEGRTTEEMTYPYSENTFVDWDFYSVWAVDFDYEVNNGYPFLQCQNYFTPLSTPPSVGDGSPENPYEIENMGNLYWIAENADRWSLHYIQTADIDASATTGWFEGQGWSPIGNISSSFTGTYDGQGHKIDGLFINRPGVDYIGLFGRTGSWAIVSNLGLINVNVTGSNNVGGLIGSGSTNNCYSNGSVKGSEGVGGLIGSGSANNCYSSGSVEGYWRVGGLIGEGMASNSYSTAEVKGLSKVGGLTGNSEEEIINCYSIGKVIGQDNVGGLVGAPSWASAINSYWNIETSGQVSSAAGEGRTTGEMQLPFETMTYYLWDFIDTWAAGADIEFNNGYPYHQWQWEIPPSQEPFSGDGTTDNPFEIESIENLRWIAENSERWDYHYIQTEDIDATVTNEWFKGTGWKPIGNIAVKFSGSYNGNNHVIDGLYINRLYRDHQGLFGYTDGAKISNLGVTNIDISGKGSVGGLVGHNNGSDIINCYVAGNIESIDSYVGGLAGNNHSSSLINSYSNVYIKGTRYYAGGLAGNNFYSSIYNCYSLGNVEGERYVGGLVGVNNRSAIINSYSVGTLTGNLNVGGLVGHIFTGDGFEDTNNYWNTETSGVVSSAMGEGRTTEEMTFAYANNTFTEWNFCDVWAADIGYEINNGYPFLQWQDYFIPVSSAPSKGFGTLSNPYQIENLCNLYWIAEDSERWAYSYIQTADINASPTKGWFDGNGWSPIGDNSENNNATRFTGTYDGLGHIIEGLFINRPEYSNIGLFGRTEGARIENLGVTNIEITADNYVGGMAGYNGNSDIINSFSEGVINGIERVGGLVGYSYNSNINSSYSSVSVSGSLFTGGLAGHNGYSNITDCYSTGNVTGDTGVGGLIGDNYYSDVNNSYSIGNVEGNSNYGGLIGSSNESSVNNSYWNTETSGQSNSGGGDGRTTEQMKYPHDENSYIDWDFINIWSSDVMSEINNGYPYLVQSINCISPTSIVVSNISTNSAEISWIPGNTESFWNVETGLTGFEPGTDNHTARVIQTEDNPLEVTGLSSNTNYHVYVQALCNIENAEVSYWAGPVSFTTLISCFEPTALTATNITLSSAILDWVAGGEETFWNLKYHDMEFDPETEGTLIPEITKPYMLENLTPQTDYHFSVQAVCSAEDFSLWSSSYLFKTGCESFELPFTQSFNSEFFPSCWSQSFEDGLISDRWSVFGSENAGGESYEMRAEWSNNNGISRLISPPLDLSSANNIILEFKHFYEDWEEGATFKIQSSADGETWIDEEIIFTSGNGNIGPETVTVSITTLSATTLIAWVIDGEHFSFDYWYIDDVSIYAAAIQVHDLTLMVDMRRATEFDPEEDVVYVTGSMFDGAVPGEEPDNQIMTRINSGFLYTITLQVEEGGLSYKYYINDGWEGGEWNGQPERDVNVDGDLTVNNTWGMPGPAYPVSFNITDYQGSHIPDAVIELNGFVYNPGEYELGYLPDGNYDFSISADNYITCSGNLNIESESITFDVELAGNELTISGSFTASDKIYDGTRTASIDNNNLSLYGISEEFNNVSLTDIIIEFEDHNASPDQITVSIVSADITGEDAGKYTLSLTGAPAAQSMISHKNLTVTGAKAGDKVYDGTTAAIIESSVLQGIISGDDVHIDALNGTFSQAHAGTDIGVTAFLTLKGDDAGNYTLTQPTGLKADITAKELTVDGIAAIETKEYDATETATFTGETELIGVIEEDESEVYIEIIEALFVDSDIGENKEVSVSFTLGGIKSGNYKVAEITNLKGDIKAKELTLDGAEAEDKIYDGTTDAVISEATLQRVLDGEDVYLDEFTGTFSQAQVGTDIEVTASLTLKGDDADNYALTQPTGLAADITPKELTITGTFSTSDKEYDGTRDAQIVDNNLELSGIVGDDDVELANVIIEFEQSDAGDDIAVLITGADLAGEDRGNYTLTLEGAPTSTASIITTTGINILITDNFSMFPNPFSDYLYLKNSEIVQKITITNLYGQLVMVKNIKGENKINTLHLNRGVYMVTIQYDNNETKVFKMLKK